MKYKEIEIKMKDGTIDYISPLLSCKLVIDNGIKGIFSTGIYEIELEDIISYTIKEVANGKDSGGYNGR